MHSTQAFTGLCALAALAAPIASRAQTPPAVFVKLSTSQVAAGAVPATAATTTIAAPPSGWGFSAAAPYAGTTWNTILRPNPLIGSNLNSPTGEQLCTSASQIDLLSPSGSVTGVELSIWLNIQDLEGNTTRTEPNTASGGNSVLGPSGLMAQAWRIYRGGNTTRHQLTGLPAGAHYHLYLYASTTAAGQGARLTLDASNVPGGDGIATSFIETRGGNSGNIFAFDGANYSLTTPAVVNVASTSTDTTTWGRIHAVVNPSGMLTFRTGKNAANGQYLNGYQLVPFPKATISQQPPATSLASVGGDLTLIVAATGEGTLTYRWRKDGSALTDGASGSGSSYAGASTSSLTVSGVSSADNGSYDVVVTNEGGEVISNASVVTVTSSAIAPSIVTPPASTTAVTGGSVTFTTSANGTAPLNFQWQKSVNGVDYADVEGATGASLLINPVSVADAGRYRVVVTNSVDSATSAVANLVVAPVLATPPSAAIVTSGAPHTASVVADAGIGSPESVSYTWKRDGSTLTNGANISGSTSSSLSFAAFSPSDSGVYTVIASNSAGSITSTGVFIGLASVQPLARFPQSGSVAVNPDTPLIVTFTAPPRVGSTGRISVRRTSDDALIESIDLATLSTIVNGSAVYRYKNRTIGGASGNTYNYLPIVTVGNELRISLASSTALDLNTAYYVTVEPGALLDSTGASHPAINDTSTWTFTTKAAAAPSVPTATTFTVAIDGSGDFSSIQGVLDHIPSGNTTPILIEVRAGIYDGIVNTGNRSNLTFVGEGHEVTIIQGLNNDRFNPGTAFRSSFYAKGSDLLFRNLSINNTTPKGGSQAETLRTDGSRVIFVGCAFRSFQDTLLLGGTSYFLDCLIQGDTDYIWGGGNALFQRCELRCMNAADLTQSRAPVGRFGLVFIDCAITKPAGSSFSYSFGRTSDNGNAAFIDCRLDSHISAAGWSSSFGSINLRNWEFNSRNLAGTAAVNVAQRILSRQLSQSEADILRLPANVFGPTTDGNPSGAQGGGWIPVFTAPPPPTISSHPQSISAPPGQSVTLSVSAAGGAHFTYQWRKGGVPLTGEVASSLALGALDAGDVGDYDVIVTNSGGSTPSDSASVTLLTPFAAWADGYGLDIMAPDFASADEDGDGFANLVEFVLGRNPTQSDSVGHPAINAVQDETGKRLVFEYVRAVSASSIQTVVETSPDFATWTARTPGVDATVEVIPQSSDRELVRVTIPYTSDRFFVKLRAIE